MSLSLAFPVVVGVHSSSADIRLPSIEQRLAARGFACETTADLREALEAADYSVRRLAMHLLVKRQGLGATKKLTQMLSDEHIQVRVTAARLLGSLGHDTGLRTMNRDLQQLMPLRIAHYDQTLLEQIGDANVANAMDVARVLAELGDPQGYKLAGLTVLKGRLEAQRYRAVHVLFAIAKINPRPLKRAAFDPLGILEVVASREKSDVVLRQVLAELAREGLDARAKTRILAAVINSKHASERVRTVARRVAQRVRQQQ